eukprot:scaffold27422_cov70-Phaeocystis_antarctica.AAC.5
MGKYSLSTLKLQPFIKKKESRMKAACPIKLKAVHFYMRASMSTCDLRGTHVGAVVGDAHMRGWSLVYSEGWRVQPLPHHSGPEPRRPRARLARYCTSATWSGRTVLLRRGVRAEAACGRRIGPAEQRARGAGRRRRRWLAAAVARAGSSDVLVGVSGGVGVAGAETHGRRWAEVHGRHRRCHGGVSARRHRQRGEGRRASTVGRVVAGRVTVRRRGVGGVPPLPGGGEARVGRQRRARQQPLAVLGLGVVPIEEREHVAHLLVRALLLGHRQVARLRSQAVAHRVAALPAGWRAVFSSRVSMSVRAPCWSRNSTCVHRVAASGVGLQQPLLNLAARCSGVYLDVQWAQLGDLGTGWRCHHTRPLRSRSLGRCSGRRGADLTRGPAS